MPVFNSPLRALLLPLVLVLSGAALAAPGSTPQLQGDARILHALNRLTFGPRPGDVAAVKAMGLNAWIEQQLHPAAIDDSALENKLQQYPALQMSLPQLMLELPPPPVIRQAIDGHFAVPADQPLNAVYQTQIALVEMRRQAQSAKRAGLKDQAQTVSASTTPGASDGSLIAAQHGSRVSPEEPGIAIKQRQLLADLEATGIVNLPPAQRIAKLLAMQPLERIGFYRDLSGEERLAFVQGMTPQQAQLVSAMRNPVRTVGSQLQAAKVLRTIDSNRQLQQVMIDFWFNRFNVDIRKSPLMPYYLTQYERTAIEPNALGHFEDLLLATAHSPAMLLYLDNASSVGPDSPAAQRLERQNAAAQPKRTAPGLNENYARELMELQTVGVDGGYTQKDVIEVARAFSGWTIDRPLRGGGFVFNPQRHEPGARYVLGHAIRSHGEQQGLDVLHILANSPATAHHISEEIAQRFVSDHPPRALVDRMAATFLATHGDIRQVLHAMLSSPEFWDSGTHDEKIKTPLELAASAARASGTQVEYPVVLAAAVARLGMPLYNCQPPTGYSSQAEAWVSSGSLVERMNFAMAFAENRLPGIINRWDSLLGADASTLPPSQKESRLEQLLLHRNVSAPTHQALMNELLDATAQPQLPRLFPLGNGAEQGYIVPTAATRQPQPADKQAATIAGLLIGSPDFQNR